MSISVDHMIDMLMCRSSPELEAQFLLESQDPHGEVRRMLKGMEVWAKTKLNPNSPSPANERTLGTIGAGSLRKAGMADSTGMAGREPDVNDLIEYLGGRGSESMRALIGRALMNPDSELSKLLIRQNDPSKSD